MVFPVYSILVFNLIGWDSFRALLEALYASMSALQTSSPGLSSLPESVVSTVSISIFQFHVDLCVTCSLPTCLTSVTSSLCLRSKVHVRHQLHVLCLVRVCSFLTESREAPQVLLETLTFFPLLPAFPVSIFVKNSMPLNLNSNLN